MLMLDIENNEKVEEISRIFHAQTFWKPEDYINNGFRNGENYDREVMTNEESTLAYYQDY